jgi:hypothetical protein
MTDDALTVMQLGQIRDAALALGLALIDAAWASAPAGEADPRTTAATHLAPRPEDFARLFTDDRAATIAAAYAAAFETPPFPMPKRGQTEVHVTTCPAALIGSDHPLAQAFPGGYRELAPHLRPGIVWAVLRFTVPGERLGMAYDGFAWLPDGAEAVPGRFVWVPKPWRLA